MRKLLVVIIILQALTIPLITAAAADDERIAVKAEVDKAFITIGERITYTVTVRHSPSIRLATQIRFPNTRDFEIKGVQDILPTTGEDGLIYEGRTFIITSYTLGKYVIEGAAIQYLTSNNETKEIKTDQVFITVESINAADKEKTDIRGIKGVVGIPNRFLLISIVLVLLAFFVGTAYFIARRILLKKKKYEGEFPLLPPDEEAHKALNQLFNSDLIKNKQFKVYYFRLSEIERRYIERRFSVHAVEMTTMEILYNLKAIRMDDALRKKIGSFLSHCDLVKFAKYIPESNEIEGDKKLAVEIVDLTKPHEEPGEENTEASDSK